MWLTSWRQWWLDFHIKCSWVYGACATCIQASTTFMSKESLFVELVAETTDWDLCYSYQSCDVSVRTFSEIKETFYDLNSKRNLAKIRFLNNFRFYSSQFFFFYLSLFRGKNYKLKTFMIKFIIQIFRTTKFV